MRNYFAKKCRFWEKLVFCVWLNWALLQLEKKLFGKLVSAKNLAKSIFRNQKLASAHAWSHVHSQQSMIVV